MKRFSYILLAGLSLVAAASCSKQNPQEPEQPAGIPMTLTATIGGPDTKLGFTKDGNVLKGTWDANEEVSVLTISGGMILTIDKFSTGTGSAGQTTAAFTGTFTGNPAHTIEVIYPALENYSGTFGTPLPTGITDDSKRMIRDLNTNNLTYYLSMLHSTQSANGNTDHLGAFSLMFGDGTVSGDNLSVTLVPQISVLQVNISFADGLVGKTFGAIEAIFQDGESNDCYLFPTTSCALLSSFSNTYQLVSQYYGSWSGGTQTPITLTTADQNFVAYIPFVPGAAAKIGGTGGAAKIEFNPEIDGAFNTYKKTVDLTGSGNVVPGKVYRVSMSIGD